MISRERRQYQQTEVVPAAVTCDRCGETAKHGSGFLHADYPFEGTYIRGMFFPESGNSNEIEHIEAELCGPCSRDLTEWIGGGVHIGRKGRDLVENIKDV